MIRLVVGVRDGATGLFGQPWFVVARGQAIRIFSDEVNRADSEPAKHPDDYELFALAEFDEGTGRFGSIGEPDLLIRGKDCIHAQK